MKRKNKDIPICPKCNGKDVRSRIRTKDFWCRRCGHIGKREEFFKKKEVWMKKLKNKKSDLARLS